MIRRLVTARFVRAAGRAQQNGFALLIVLWTLVLLAFLLTQMLAAGHGALSLAANLRAQAQARASADGAINAAVFQLLAPEAARWKMGGPPHVVAVGAARVTVRVRTLAGLINPNLASAPLLSGLLEAVAVPPDQARALAAAIIAWRSPPDTLQAGTAIQEAYRRAGRKAGPAAQPFAALGELNDVLGMTPKIYASLAPRLSLFQAGDPDPAAADPLVARALALAHAAGPGSGGYTGAPVADVTACVTGGLCRHAVVSLPGSAAQKPFRVLALEDLH